MGEDARDPGCELDVLYFLIMCSTVAPGILRFFVSGVCGSGILPTDAKGDKNLGETSF